MKAHAHAHEEDTANVEAKASDKATIDTPRGKSVLSALPNCTGGNLRGCAERTPPLARSAGDGDPPKAFVKSIQN